MEVVYAGDVGANRVIDWGFDGARRKTEDVPTLGDCLCAYRRALTHENHSWCHPCPHWSVWPCHRADEAACSQFGNDTDADNSCALQNLELRFNLQVIVCHILSINGYDFGSNALSWLDGGDRFANENNA
jgi:hypothetical protein